MTNREEYIADLKARLERCNAAISRLPAANGPDLAMLRELRERLLGKLRLLERQAA